MALQHDLYNRISDGGAPGAPPPPPPVQIGLRIEISECVYSRESKTMYFAGIYFRKFTGFIASFFHFVRISQKLYFASIYFREQSRK